MAGCQRGQAIPTQLGLGQFEQFVLPHLATIEKVQLLRERLMNIATWLRALGLEQYEQVFRDNAIDYGIILNLNDTELASLATGCGFRRKLAGLL
jgi:hypothetical protein